MSHRVKRRRHVKRWRGTNYRKLRAQVFRTAMAARAVLAGLGGYR